MTAVRSAANYLPGAIEKATSWFSSNRPEVLAKAKGLVGASAGVAASSLNLGQFISSAPAGARVQRAQMVAESLVRSGAAVDQIFRNHDTRVADVFTDAELISLQADLMALEAETRAAAMSVQGNTRRAPKGAAALLKARNVDIARAMRLLGIDDPENLFFLVIMLNTLTEEDIENFVQR